MSMFPHTVTIYNTEIDIGPDMKDTTTNHITVLRGVLLDATKAANVSATGLTGADDVTLYIPKDVVAEDGFTGAQKHYLGPTEFWKAEDKSGKWTLSVDGNGGDTFFVKGEVVEDRSFEAISLGHDDVYNITKVDDKDFGGDMSHWQVGGA